MKRHARRLLLTANFKPCCATYSFAAAPRVQNQQLCKIQSLKRFLPQLLRKEKPSTFRTDVLLLLQAFNSKNEKQAKEIFASIQDDEAGLKSLPSQTLITIIKCLTVMNGQKECMEWILNTLRKVHPDKTRMFIDAMLEIRINRKEISEAEGIIGYLQQESSVEGSSVPAPSLREFNRLLNGYCDAKLTDKMVPVVQFLQESGVEPDIYTYSILIKALLNEKQYSEAESVYKECISRGIKPDRILHCMLIEIYCFTGRVKAALGLLDSIEKPCNMFYNVLLGYYLSTKDLRGAYHAVDHMRSRGLSLNAEQYSLLMKIHLAREEFDDAVNLFGQLEAYGLKPNADTYTALFLAIVSSANIAAYNDFIKRVLLERRELRTPEFYLRILKRMMECQMFKETVPFYFLLSCDNVMPHGRVLAMLFTFLYRHQRHKEINEIFDMCKNQYHGQLTTLPFVIFIYAVKSCRELGLFEKEEALKREMQSYGVVPDMKHFELNIDKNLRRQDINSALKFFERMLELGYTPTPQIIERLRNLYAAKSTKSELHLFDEQLKLLNVSK